MTLDQVISELKAKASGTTKRTLLRHGAKEPYFGVRIGDMKPIHRKIKGDQALAMELYATGIGDAQYLAGMVADGRRMTAKQLQTWVDTASWSMISATTVPWVASEHPEGLDLALKWIDSGKQSVEQSGWNTLSAIATLRPDAELPVEKYSALLDRVARTIGNVSDTVRYAMNGFVIAVGTYVAELGDKAIDTARRIGKVEVDMGDTACKVPDAGSYIIKSRRGAAIAPKRRTIRC